MDPSRCGVSPGGTLRARLSQGKPEKRERPELVRTTASEEGRSVYKDGRPAADPAKNRPSTRSHGFPLAP